MYCHGTRCARSLRSTARVTLRNGSFNAAYDPSGKHFPAGICGVRDRIGIVFIFLIDVVNLLVFYGVGPKTVISRHPLRNLAQRFRYASGTSHADAKRLSALDRYPRLGLPFASFGDAAVEKYVVTSGKLDPEYYVAIVGVYSPAALERKLRDVGRAECSWYPIISGTTARRQTRVAPILRDYANGFFTRPACLAAPIHLTHWRV